MKTCRCCYQTKPYTEFSPRLRMKDGHKSECKACKKQLSHEYYLRHRELRPKKNRLSAEETKIHEKASERAYYLKNSKRIYQRVRAWIATHPEQWCAYRKRWIAAHPEQMRAHRKRWAQKNAQRIRDFTQQRRARQRHAPLIEQIDRFAIAERDGWRCHICARKVAKSALSIDHLIPLLHHGSHTPQNVALAHRSCNSRRGAGRLPAQLRLFG